MPNSSTLSLDAPSPSPSLPAGPPRPGHAGRPDAPSSPFMHTTQGLRALDMRDDLEKQVLGLAHQRDALEADMTSMANMQHSVQELEAEVCVCVGGGGGHTKNYLKVLG